MAKQSGEFSFADLNKEMNKNSRSGGIVSEIGRASCRERV